MLPPVYRTLVAAPAVVAIVDRRIYRHNAAPQDVRRPYVTWFLINAVPENHLSGTPPVDRMSFQVDCWHPTDAGAEELATAVRDALEPFAHMTGQPIDGRERETKLWRMALEFDWFFDRVEPSS